MKKSNYLFALALGASTLTFAQVGIGTSSPSNPLDIQADNAAIDINNNNAGDGDPVLNFQIDGGAEFSIGVDDSDADKLKIATDATFGTTALTIDASQNVGIGTTSPGALLDVAGSAHMSGSTTEAVVLDIGVGRSGNGNSYIDLIGDATYTDYGLRIIRNNTGENSTSKLVHRGTGTFLFEANESADITFRTSAVERFSIAGAGDVTINDGHEAVDFRVEGDTEANLLFVDGSADRIGIGTSSPDNQLTITQALQFNSWGGASSEKFGLYSWNGNLEINPRDANGDFTQTGIVLNSSSEVGIKNLSPSVELDVTGDIEYTGTITDVSDRRLKENFSSIDSVLTKIMKIKGLSYNMINDSLKTREYGVIAQDVQAVFPEMVTTVDPENGYLGVAYIQLIPVLLEGMKEQQAIIESQKKEIAKEKAENESQKAEIESLKAEASNSSAETNQKLDANTSEIEALKAQVQQLLQLLQQQESVSVVK